MDTVPQIISTKDFAYLSDMFEWNYNAYKEVNSFISEVKDEKIKELLERVCNMHEDHMNFIISILKKEDTYGEDGCECEVCTCEECEDESYEEEGYENEE